MSNLKDMQLLASLLMFASFALLIVGLAGNWWHGSLDLAAVSGTGHVSLWQFDTGVNSIDSMCGDSLQVTAAGNKICGKIAGIHVMIFTALLSAIIAAIALVFLALGLRNEQEFNQCEVSTAELRGHYQDEKHQALLSVSILPEPTPKRNEQDFSKSNNALILRFAAAFGIVVDITCTIVGLSLAASMPFSQEALKLGVAGSGVMCTLVQLGLCTITLALQLCSCCCSCSEGDGKAVKDAGGHSDVPVVVAQVV